MYLKWNENVKIKVFLPFNCLCLCYKCSRGPEKDKRLQKMEMEKQPEQHFTF